MLELRLFLSHMQEVEAHSFFHSEEDEGGRNSQAAFRMVSNLQDTNGKAALWPKHVSTKLVPLVEYFGTNFPSRKTAGAFHFSLQWFGWSGVLRDFFL